MQHFYNLNGINIYTGVREDIKSNVIGHIENNSQTWVITLNSLMYMEYLENETYVKSFNECSFSIPDGVGIVKFLKKRNVKTDRYAGIDLTRDLLEYSKSNNLNVYFLGAEYESVNKACNLLKEKGVNIVGFHDGFFENEQEIIDEINSLNVDMLFVGMGIPRQELFILNNKSKLNVKFLMGVGGSIDVFSNKVSRAPKFFQKLGLEWLYRMILEPKRFSQFPKLLKFYFNLYFKK